MFLGVVPPKGLGFFAGEVKIKELVSTVSDLVEQTPDIAVSLPFCEDAIRNCDHFTFALERVRTFGRCADFHDRRAVSVAAITVL